MGSIVSWYHKDPRTPVKGIGPRLKNIAIRHFRGLLGVIVPILVLSWQPRRDKSYITVRCLWMWMFWFFLIQPVNIPVTGFIPMFLLPMTGVMATSDVCKCYFNDNIGLHVLAGMIHLLINGCGVDRRLILWFLCSGRGSSQFSGKRMILKASTAAFFLSMISNRLIVTSTITQFLTPAYMSLQSSTASNRKNEPDYDVMRYVVLNAVQTSSAIGSTAILHAALTTLAMRAIWCSHPGRGFEYADIFNYLQYTCFAFPVALVMFIANFLYHSYILLNGKVNKAIGKGQMSASSMIVMRDMLLQHKNALPPAKTHEKLCIFFYFAYLACCFFRWSDWLKSMSNGWSAFRSVGSQIPLIKDATVAALFVVGLHVLPRSFSLKKYFIAKKKSELGVLKPESSIMWWRFVDKNTNYGYIILMGAGIALNAAIRASSLNTFVTDKYAKQLTDLPWHPSIFIVCLVSVVLANIMSGVAACCIFLPFILNMTFTGVSAHWAKRAYLGAVAVGIGTSMGFASPFLFTPAYFCHYTGKVPRSKMAIYSIGSIIICTVILWLALCFWGPLIWDPNNAGIGVYGVSDAAIPTPPSGGDGGGGGGGEGEGGGGEGGGGEERIL